jgi:hypothetical protein
MRTLFLAILLSFVPATFAQSIWLETGLSYQGTETGTYDASPKFGIRGTFPLGDTAGLFVAAGIRGGLVLDAGGWFTFPAGVQDPTGFQSYAGAGLSYTAGRFGLAVSAALSYELEQDLELFIMYTHRPLLLPRISQAFDISAGVKLTLQ